MGTTQVMIAGDFRILQMKSWLGTFMVDSFGDAASPMLLNEIRLGN